MRRSWADERERERDGESENENENENEKTRADRDESQCAGVLLGACMAINQSNLVTTPRTTQCNAMQSDARMKKQPSFSKTSASGFCRLEV
jgi:hypothetical protein